MEKVIDKIWTLYTRFAIYGFMAFAIYYIMRVLISDIELSYPDTFPTWIKNCLITSESSLTSNLIISQLILFFFVLMPLFSTYIRSALIRFFRSMRKTAPVQTDFCEDFILGLLDDYNQIRTEKTALIAELAFRIIMGVSGILWLTFPEASRAEPMTFIFGGLTLATIRLKERLALQNAENP